MTDSGDSQSTFDVEKFEAEFDAASTDDEKFAVLEKYLPHDDAVCWMEGYLNPTLPGGRPELHDAPVDEPVVR
jgi:hypothetical protein